MQRFTKFATVAVLAASLAPFAAQARSGSLGTTYPPRHLVSIANAPAAPAQHGRLAANGTLPATLTTAPGTVEYANSDNDDGFAG